MKATRYLFTFLVLATLALSSCHNDDLPGGNTLPEGAVHITADIEGVQTRAPQLDADGAGSFEPADEWGMYTFTGDATSPAYSNQNIVYRAGNSNPLYWKDLSETEAVTFSAHYPRITNTMPDIDDPAAYLYMPQAWNHTDDLLHATATASKGTTVALTFKHLMHRLVINLAAGDGMTGTNLSSALINSVAKNGAPTMFASVEVNLLTGVVNYDRVDGSVILSNEGGANADWKVAPPRPHRRCGMAQNNRRRGCVVLSCTCRPEPCRARQPNPPRKRQAAHPQPQAKEKLRHGRHRGGTHRQQHLRLGHAAGDYG